MQHSSHKSLRMTGDPTHDQESASQAQHICSASEQQLQQVPNSSPAGVAAEACWLTGLQLMAVQPACLRAHPDTPIPEQQLHQLQDMQVDVHQQLQHDMLLHLEAVLTGQKHQVSANAMQDQPLSAPCPPVPLQLSDVELQLVLLSRQMQVIQQQQYSLLQLILQQQQQRSPQKQPFVLPPAPATTALETSSVVKSTDSPACGAAALLVGGSSSRPAESPAATALQEPASASSWTQPLNLHVSLPCRPTSRLLDALHLVLTIRGIPAQTQQQQATSSISTLGSSSFVCDPGGSSSSTSHRQQQQQEQREAALAALVAEVPLLVLPAVAQQEVQQLLLPAMRQEVQAEQQQQQQPGFLDLSPEHFASQVLQVEYASWRHYCQLANDMFAVMELAVAAEAAAAAAAAAAVGPQGVSAAEAAPHQAMPSIAVVPAGAAGPEGAAAALAAATSAAALGEVTDALLFPLLLPFLAAHGLHNVLHLLVGCLPLHLQQQWQQQQLGRLQHLAVTGPPALQLPVVLEDEEQQQQADQAASVQENDLAGVPVTPTAAVAAAAAQLGGSPGQQLVPSDSPDSPPPKARQRQQQAVTAGNKDDKDTWYGQPDALEQQSHTAPATTSCISAAPSSAGAGAVHVTWLTPLKQFEGDMEQRYIVWKHHSLIHLDYLCALFDAMYLAVLFKRTVSEPTTLWYFSYILIKTLPHLPLMLGLRQPFLRYREVWIFLVAPATLVLTAALTLFHWLHGQPNVFLPNRASKAFESSRAELVTSFMRPFMQHMRLPMYIVYCSLDAAVAAFVMAQSLGVWSALQRWSVAAFMSISLCWMFEFVLRRRFALRDYQQQLHQAGGAAAAPAGKAVASRSEKGQLVQRHAHSKTGEATHDRAGPSSPTYTAKEKQL